MLREAFFIKIKLTQSGLSRKNNINSILNKITLDRVKWGMRGLKIHKVNFICKILKQF